MGRVISKEALIKCACTFTGRVAFTEADGWLAKCPDCGKTHSVDGKRGKRIQDFGGNRRFTGDERVSVTEGCHPREVGTYQRLFDGTGAVIRGNGQVEFKDRQTQRKYMGRKTELIRRGVIVDD